MQLTEDHVEAARARGCRFIPASEAQVRQFSMQRRVFQIGGQPFLAERGDGFFETAGTLMALVAEALEQREGSAPLPEADVARPARTPRRPRRMAAGPPAQAPVPLSARQQARLMAATAVIARGYARGHTVRVPELGALLSSVHHALRSLG